MPSATVTNYGSFGPNTETQLETVFTSKEAGAGIQTQNNIAAFAAGIIQTPVVYSGATDAIAYPATAFLTRAGVDAATLATPAATTDDGKILTVISTSAQAHTVTTAANKIASGNSTALGDTLTFAAKQGASFSLIAYQGLWYVLVLNNVTLSEV